VQVNTTDFRQTDTWDVIVVGAGAAGLFAAGTAAARGRRTLLLEKNVKLGVKILMSGGTRCNITHDTDWRGIADAFGSVQARFLKFALASFPPEQVIEFFESRGVPTKVEPGGKVFPVSNRAIDVRDALVNFASDSGALIRNRSAVTRIISNPTGFQVHAGQTIHESASLIVASGGQSYPDCGTSGDGYAWLRDLGHRIVVPRPALTPLRIAENWVRNLSGVSVDDVQLTVGPTASQPNPSDRVKFRGALLFTHAGISGPAAMNASRALNDPKHPQAKEVICEFLPTLKEQQFLADLHKASNAQGASTTLRFLAPQLPKRLVESLCNQHNVLPSRRLAELSRSELSRLAQGIKRCKLTVAGTLGFKKAEVTAGGAALENVHSKSMESRLVPRLFLAGEILDIDGPIGGYNFQAAFCTGKLAGEHA